MAHNHLDNSGTPIPAVLFLSGSRRGEIQRLVGDEVRVGTDPAADVVIPLDTEPTPLPHHATLLRRGLTYAVRAEPGGEVWVNGESLDHLVLASGDVMEIGRDGAVLRFRLYEPESAPYKSLGEIFSDCAECVRAERTTLGKATAFASVMPRELATRTTRRFRALTAFAIVVIAVATTLTAGRSARIEAQLLDQIERIEGISELADRTETSTVGTGELGDIVAELRSTRDRVQALEARNEATARVIEQASAATLFLQGSFGFTHTASGRPLRRVVGPDGTPRNNAFGQPALTVEGEGPPFSVFVTGTGFVVSSDGLAVTNRHVAQPWEFDDAAQGLLQSGFTAQWHRFVGFLADGLGAHELVLLATSDEADVAIVEVTATDGGSSAGLPFVELADAAPTAGDPVIVIGYPLGLRALMARSDADFIERLQNEGVADFFQQAERIARAGFMTPLATRGIVGQVTSARVVYDAETTSGGSGGPVLSLDGQVLAVNTAILPEFGGSNLGVPIAQARRLIQGLPPGR